MAESDKSLRVFISYARRDASAFAEELLAGLEVAGFDPFLDRHDVAGGEDWEARLGGLIHAADTVVFVVSPAAVSSERCAWEVTRAEAQSKRIIPVVLSEVPEADVPKSLKRLNYIFFSEGHSFARSLGDLAKALRTDLDWVREHTRLAELAARWRERDKSEVLLLRGAELDAAKAWLAAWKAGAPEPTDLHRALIRDSEAAELSRTNAERQQLEEMAAAQAEKEKALQRLSRRTAIGLAGAGGLTAAAAGLAAWGADAERRVDAAEANSVEAAIARAAARTDIVGQFTAYASAPRQPASAEPLYSHALIEALRDRNASLQDAFAVAQARVYEQTGSQRPYFSSDLNGDIFLQRPSGTRALKALVVAVDHASGPGLNLASTVEEAALWAETLGPLGFETVHLVNPSNDELREAIYNLEFLDRFGEAPRRSDGKPISSRSRAKGFVVPQGRNPGAHDTLALLIYTGFGLTFQGEASIMTPEFDGTNPDTYFTGAVPLSFFQDRLRVSTAASVIILNADFIDFTFDEPPPVTPPTPTAP